MIDVERRTGIKGFQEADVLHELGADRDCGEEGAEGGAGGVEDDEAEGVLDGAVERGDHLAGGVQLVLREHLVHQLEAERAHLLQRRHLPQPRALRRLAAAPRGRPAPGRRGAGGGGGGGAHGEAHLGEADEGEGGGEVVAEEGVPDEVLVVEAGPGLRELRVHRLVDGAQQVRDGPAGQRARELVGEAQQLLQPLGRDGGLGDGGGG